jgi:rare lipoprotein A
VTRSLGPRRLLCALAAAALVVPVATAAADDPPATGGVEAPEPVTTTSVVTADGPVAVTTRAGTMVRRYARFRGAVDAAEAGRTVAIERFDEETQAWAAVATTTVAPDGSYAARWRADRAGVERVRAVLQHGGSAAAATASDELAITVHRPARATWFGPGFYGRRTACGQRMTRTLLGVAHRTLRCGTQVALLYRGRTLTVPVVDRGPFRKGTRWDLTAATATALGFEHTDRVGALRLAPTLP